MSKDKKNKRADLGKGIGALLSSFDSGSSSPRNNRNTANTPPPPPPPAKKEIAKIPVDKIEVNPYQPRKKLEQEALEELSSSIKLHGVIQPITVREMGDGTYQLISGERRTRASRLAGLTEIPAYIRTADDKEMQEMALIENLQREDLSPMEVATTYKLLIDKYTLTQEELSKRVGKSRVAITQVLSLLTLPPDVVNALNNKEISRGHAIVLAREEDVAIQLMLLKRIVEEKLSVRSLEKIVANLKNPTATPAKQATPAGKLPLEYQKVQEDLIDRFSAKVTLKRQNNGKGQIVIPFNSDSDLNRLLDLFEE